MKNFIEDSKIEIPAEPILDLGASTGVYRLSSSIGCIPSNLRGRWTRTTSLQTQNGFKSMQSGENKSSKPRTGKHKRSPFSLVVMDLSFISLTRFCIKREFVRCGGTLIALVKPQFECLRRKRTAGVA